MHESIWMWIGFIVFVITMLLVDLQLLGGKKSHKVSVKEALSWSIVWFMLAMIFNVLIWWYFKTHATLEIANEKAMQFLTGYAIEKSLSIDNVFVFVMIFTFFKIPAIYQRRILIYGVIGAVVLRFIMISLGLWLVSLIEWVLYFFGAFLIFSGIKLFFVEEDQDGLKNSVLIRCVRKVFRFTDTITSQNFFERKNNLLYGTPLLLALIFVEFSDIVFAIDSIPAIFAITRDKFIIFTSNIFAILGLRALYFLLADMHERFVFLKFGIAIVLVFVGMKMLLAHWYKFPTVYSLLVIVVVLGMSIFMSLMLSRKQIRKINE